MDYHYLLYYDSATRSSDVDMMIGVTSLTSEVCACVIYTETSTGMKVRPV